MTWGYSVAAIVLGAACNYGSGLVPCGDQLCPAGSVCVADRCASPEQVTACEGRAEQEMCQVTGGTGYCVDGLCTLSGCGDSTIDVGEACDDGNQDSGDGCRGDCRKIEMCGDAEVDANEACDDGNANPADGCNQCAAAAWLATALIGGQIDPKNISMDPLDVAVDRAGALYIADAARARVLRRDPSGTLTIIAGTGERGYSGDDGLATSAKLFSPTGVSVDDLGNVYVVDSSLFSGTRLRRIDSRGRITTVTTNITYGVNGVEIDGLGSLYVPRGHTVDRLDPDGTVTRIAGDGVGGFAGDGGPATSARLQSVKSVTLHGGVLYITDGGNHRIRRVDANGIITTVAGDGSTGTSGDGGAATAAGIGYPQDVTVDSGGNLLIAQGASIRRVDTSGQITTFVGGTAGFAGDGGLASQAKLRSPTGLAFDAAGQLYIGEAGNFRVRRIDTAGIIDTVAGNGDSDATSIGSAATCTMLAGVAGVAVAADGTVYFTEYDWHRVRRISPTGVLTTIAGNAPASPSTKAGFSGDGGLAVMAELGSPFGLAIDDNSNVYIADSDNNRIRRVDPSGIITTIAGNGTIGSSGDGGPATSAALGAVWTVGVDSLGRVIIGDDARIRRVSTTGIITTIAGTGVPGLSGDGGPAVNAQVSFPYGLAVGSDDSIYFENDGRVRRIDPNGIITTVAGGGTATGEGIPATTAATSAGAVGVDVTGNVYFANSNKVFQVDTAGLLRTYAGGGTSMSGDGGPRTDASSISVEGIGTDAAGRVYLAAYDSVRRVANDTITTIAGYIDPEGMGPLGQARLADPRALVIAADFTLFAGGASGTVQAARSTTSWLGVVAGRYKQLTATGVLARFRDQTFGTVGGIAYDATNKLLFLTETTANRIHVVSVVDPADEKTWTIAPLANATGVAGFANGAAATAQFREPSGLYYDPAQHVLYVADTGNHVIRAIDLAAGVASATVRTVAGVPATRGFFGDGASAASALLYAPEAVTLCPNGDMFIADTGNQRVRRVSTSGTITTVAGVGVAASSGEGAPARSFPVNLPRGLACDERGNVFVSSMTTVRMLDADDSGIVDGTRAIRTIYGAPPRDTFPTSVTRCLTGIASVDATTLRVTDSCVGIMVELKLTATP